MLRFTMPVVAVFIGCLIVGCTSGSALVTGNKRDPVEPSVVKIYTEPPSSYEVIGIVKTESNAGWTQQSAVDAATSRLKKEAAGLGANGIILDANVYDRNNWLLDDSIESLTGKAVYVTE